MSARAIGSGYVSFGLVSIPVKLYSTTESRAGVSFNLLHKKCKTRLKQQYVCPADGETVERDEMIKGYEFAKGQYVTFTEDELKAIEEQKSEAIEITEFVPLEKVDPIYFDKPYYLGPDKGGDKPYKLLIEAMKQTGRAALAKYRARGKQYLVLLRPVERGLVMQQLRYADEIKPMAEVPVGDAELRDAELKLAVQLVEQIARDDFQPGVYEDEVRKRIQEQIQRKVEGQEVTAAPVESPQGKVIDLMEALKASLQARKAGPAPAVAERKGPRRADARKAAEGTTTSKRASRAK